MAVFFRWAARLLLLVSISSSSGLVDSATAAASRVRRYDSIFSFGHSFADTGNNPVVYGWYSAPDPATRPPYGSTFFGHSTGRNCDGRLVIDFIAESMGLPLVPPFLAHRGSFRRGANFAVAGSTALDAVFFHDGGEESEAAGVAVQFPFNTSLAVQLGWFERLRDSLCDATTTQECGEFLGRSLFFVGEFGFNDYFWLLAGKKKISVQQVRSVVPDVVAAISMAVERLIMHGATTLVVPGTVPVGCAAPMLFLFPGADPAAFDPRTGCLRELNKLAVHHNSLLQDSLEEIRGKHPDVDVAYADFFSPVMAMVESPGKFGFEEDVLTVCCGDPGSSYHFNPETFCGDPGATSCKDPAARLFWDSVHLTEAGNRYVAGDWLSNMNHRLALADI